MVNSLVSWPTLGNKSIVSGLKIGKESISNMQDNFWRN